MSNIIAESGLSAGAIYTHFASKDEILASVIEHALTESNRHVETAMAQSPLPHPADLLARISPGWDGPDGSIALVQVWGHVAAERQLGPLVEEHVAASRAALDRYAAHWLAEQGIADEFAAETLGGLLMGLSQAYTLHSAFEPTLNATSLREAARAAIDALVAPLICTSFTVKETNHA